MRSYLLSAGLLFALGAMAILPATADACGRRKRNKGGACCPTVIVVAAPAPAPLPPPPPPAGTGSAVDTRNRTANVNRTNKTNKVNNVNRTNQTNTNRTTSVNQTSSDQMKRTMPVPTGYAPAYTGSYSTNVVSPGMTYPAGTYAPTYGSMPAYGSTTYPGYGQPAVGVRVMPRQ